MGRRTGVDSTDVFRLKKSRILDGKEYINFEGPYLTKGATKARMAWNRGYDSLVVQQLVAKPCLVVGTTVLNNGTTLHDIGAKLEWQDVETLGEVDE